MWIAIPAWYQPLGVVSSPARGHTKLGSAQVKEPRFATKQSSPPSGCARKHSQAVKPNEWVCKTDLGDMAKPPAPRSHVALKARPTFKHGIPHGKRGRGSRRGRPIRGSGQAFIIANARRTLSAQHIRVASQRWASHVHTASPDWATQRRGITRPPRTALGPRRTSTSACTGEGWGREEAGREG